MTHALSFEERFWLDHGSDGVVLCDAACLVAHLNPAASKLLHVADESFAGCSLLPLVAPEWRDDVDRLISAGRGEEEILLVDFLGPSGRRMEVAASCCRVPWDDCGRVLFLRPGSEVTLASWVAADPDAAYRDLLDQLPSVVLEFDSTGIVLYANKAVEELTGYRPEEVQGRSAFEFVAPEAHGQAKRALAEQLADPRLTKEEYPIVHRSGEIRFVSVQTSAVVRDGRVACLRSVLTDITDNRRRESLLRASEARLAHVFRHLPIMVCALDDSGVPVVWNRECERLTGYSAEEIVGNPEYAEVLSPFPDELRLAFMGPRSPGKELRDYQVALKTNTGSAKRVSWSNVSRSVPIEGWSAWCVGVDVTVQTRVTEDLHNYLSFLETLLSTIPSPVFYKDTQGRYLGCNDAFAQEIIGLPKIEIVGKTLANLSASIPSALAAVYDETDRRLLEFGGVQRYEAQVKCADGKIREFLFLKSVFHGEQGEIAGLVGIMFDQSETNRLLAEHGRLALAVEQAPDAVMITDLDGVIEYVNRAFVRITGYSAKEALGNKPSMLKSGRQTAEQYAELWRAIAAGKVWSGRLVNRAKDGKLFVEDTKILPAFDSEGRPVNYIAVKRDITQVAELERQVLQAQKLEAVGRLAAGIAHEINTPTQYVGDNTRFLRDGFYALIDVLKSVELLERAVHEREDPSLALGALQQAKNKADIDYLLEEMPSAVDQSLEGIGRIAEIVSAMKEFSHPGSEEKTPFDLNAGVRSTTTVARNEWKYVAELELDLASDLPLVSCHPGDINQVVLNLVVNAAHAIAEKADIRKDFGKGLIRVRTVNAEERVEIYVSDTGNGIPEAVRGRIFDPFFTTKTVGKGTGQGLAMAYNVIVEKHRGTISCESTVGEGTTFIVALPVHPSDVWKES